MLTDMNSNITFLSHPRGDIHLFSCDSNYFSKWGKHTLLTSIKSGFDVHFHIINPSQEDFLFYENIKNNNLNVTMSYEKINLYQWHSLKQRSYLFCSRYFIAKNILNNDNVESILITDADLIFKRKFFLDDVDLGILYKPTQPTLWSRGGGNLFFIRKNMKDFLDDFYKEFLLRFEQNLDYDKLEKESKLVRAEKIGLDQVCLAYLIENKNYHFINLNDYNLKSKDFTDDTPIWSLTGGGKKNPNFDKILETHFYTAK